MSVRRLTLAVATATTLAAGLVLAQPAAAASGTVHTTSGKALTVRTSPSTGASSHGSIASGRKITIDCQTTGTRVKGKYGTSNVWDHVPGKGYVADAFVYTGSDGRVAKACGSSGGGAGSTTCSTTGTGNGKSCAQAVAWARAHVHSGSQSGYRNLCDHLAGLAYGWSASGSATAYVHWTQIPAKFKHAGSTSVPAGGLAFFSGGAGHVMISIGGGRFISNDIHGSGSYTATTISEIRSKWGKPYLGWAQPWFKINH